MVSRLTERTTIYLEPYVKKFLQLRALQQSKSLSQIVNELFEFQMRTFENSRTKAQGKVHPSLAEWKIVKRELDKKHHKQSK